MELEELRRSTNGTAVVFVHGVLSDGTSCWTNKNGAYWPNLLLNEGTLKAIGVQVFTYRTDFFSGSYRLGDIVDSLKELFALNDLLSERRIIFAAHSMGGIVVRKFIVERCLDFAEKDTKLGLFLIASPSLGAKYANWLSPLAKTLGHNQADALRFSQNNSWLLDLDKEFMNLKERQAIGLTGKELVEDRFVVFRQFFRKQVVEPFSGARYFGEPFKVPGSDHFSIAKPDDKTKIQHRLLAKFVSEFADKPSNQDDYPNIKKMINRGPKPT